MIVVIIAAAMALFSYFNSDKVALAASHAKPADETEYRRYHNLVEGLCIAAGLPKPRLYVVDDPAPNAFATGRNPKHAALAVTTGLLEKMNRVELEGVLAHELSHVKNYDILVTTVAVIAVGAIALLADIGLRFAFWGGLQRTGATTTTPAASACILALLAFALLDARAVRRLPDAVRDEPQPRVPRRRERRAAHALPARADLRAREAARRPGGRAPRDEGHRADVDRAAARHGDGKKTHARRFNHLFDTHPPLEDRIQRLQEM